MDDKLFIEQREDGRYLSVSKPNADRAEELPSPITQAEGIARAKGLNPNAAIHVERVRDVPWTRQG